jgi:hypothetical protein
MKVLRVFKIMLKELVKYLQILTKKIKETKIQKNNFKYLWAILMM